MMRYILQINPIKFNRFSQTTYINTLQLIVKRPKSDVELMWNDYQVKF